MAMKTLGKEFRELTRQSFARYGFAYAELLAQWPAIVGERLSAYCEPQRIKWPRAGDGERKMDGTLVIIAVPGRSLDLQHEIPHIIERINGFYGYGAIGSIKIVQGTPSQKPAPPVTPILPEDRVAALEARLATVSDPGLKDALRRLGTGALSRSPHAK
ncbi:hypothetical protein BH10PSE7_BH10PSE7_41250 [soil metagenome]